MGRLLRKKPSFIPKKKGEIAEMLGVNLPADDAQLKAVNPSSSVSPSVEKKRRPISVMPATKVPLSYPGRESLEKVKQFLREVKVELRKVTWPSRKQTIGSTVVVIVLVMIVSLFLGIVDIGLSKLAQVLLQ